MSTITRFEDLPVWQTARKLVYMVYRVTKKDAFSKDFELRNQIRGASISVMSNIAEGFEHESQAQFITFFRKSQSISR